MGGAGNEREGVGTARPLERPGAELKVLVVDDSGFFRRRLTEILEADPALRVVGGAANGRQALEMVERLQPDVVTMDVEMPVMDGVAAVRRLMASHPLPILMFSSLTQAGAQATLDALDAGAADFLPKQFEGIATDRESAKRALRDKVRALGRRGKGLAGTAPVAVAGSARVPASPLRRADVPGIVAVAASTGGPVALQQVLQALPSDFPVPVVVVQHMPAGFTAAFAQRLDEACQVRVKEAEPGDILRPAIVYVAPGGRQLEIEAYGSRRRIRISEGPPQVHYRPCADITLDSIASLYGRRALAVVLTGMGADGAEGARRLHARGARVWAQDEASSLIYGMPRAVAATGAADRVLPLAEIGPALARAAG